jgi:hypothetical protein
MPQRTTTKLKLLEASEDSAEKQNTDARVARIGPAAEKIRRVGIERLRSHMDAFYEHGSVADVFLLCAGFEEAERTRRTYSPERADLVEALMSICAVTA